MKLLHIDSSPLAANSVSRELTRRIVQEWQASHPAGTVDYLDLAADAPSHLDMHSLGFRLGLDNTQLTEAQKRENAVSERLVSQFLAADVVVVGAPMYNFSIPSTLKAWIDRIAVAGRTFRYNEQGMVEGLAGGKQVVIASSRGGFHQASGMDFQEPYLRHMFGFMGITDVSFVRAEGLAVSPEQRAASMAEALAAIQPELAAAA